MAHFSISVLLITLSIHLIASVGAVYNIVDFGAKSDYQTDAASALLSAWNAACHSNNPATIYVPNGKYLVGHVTFSGPCASSMINMQIHGTFVATSNYATLGRVGEWIVFDKVAGLSVYGGTFDGSGSGLWACKASGRNCPNGATSLTFRNSNDVSISGLSSMNSELYHIVIDNCDRVMVQGVKINAPGNSPNTDGIHVQGSTGVTITGASIRTGDDCVSIGPGTTNLWIEFVSCGPGHGISIGSLGKGYNERGVQNVTVKTTMFTGTQNGLRIKTWGRPTDAFVRGVIFEHSVMENVQNPIIIDQNYCPDNKGCPAQNSGVTISQVTYTDIHGSSASKVAVKFDCSPTNPCSGIKLQDIKLTYSGAQPAEASCTHVVGSASGFVIPHSCL
ncbi:polygalacturonase-like [Carex rostrata]